MRDGRWRARHERLPDIAIRHCGDRRLADTGGTVIAFDQYGDC